MATQVTDVLGAPITRREDLRFITGKGRYLDDIQLAGAAHMAILRSPYAHANIRSVDTNAARAMPGVLAVFTGADIPYNPLPFAWPAGGSAGLQNNVNMPRVLATDSVKWTGEGVAAVIAETPEQAVDALDAIIVDYEPLPTVVDAEKATQPGAPQLHENAPNNVVFDWTVGDKEGTDKALADAEVVISQRLVNQRLIPNAMETRGDIGWYNPGTDEYTVWMSSQTPHIQRLLLTAFVTGIPEHKVRVISPDVGGAFGSKIFNYADMALVMFASKEIGGRPVKWVETRRENYQSTIHGRDHITYLELGATRDGEVTGVKVKTYANLGGRLSTIGPGIPTTLYGRMLSGPYKIPNVFCEVIGVYTNTTFVDAYRGAGRPEATYVLERGMDLLADEIGMDPAAVRRKNFLPPDSFPHRNPSGLYRASGGAEVFIDSGNYEPALNKALTIAGYYDEIPKLKEDTRKRGKYLGVGLSTYLEICGVAPSKWIGAVGEGWGAAMWESANIKVHLTGKVILTIGTSSHGQSHETTMAQIVAHELGIPLDDVIVQHSDTQGTPFGYGTYGSRSAAVGGTAAIKAAEKVRDKARRYAAHMLEASVDDIEVDGANYRVRGSPDKVKTLQEIAFAIDLGFSLPEGMEPYLDETAYYDAVNTTWPFGTHIALVEVDEETGAVDLVRYVAVDDCGNQINPLVVAGQLHGGIAQGVGQALTEHVLYEPGTAQLMTSSLLDYALPRADLLPPLSLALTEDPTTRGDNPLRVKGGGEAGITPCLAAVVNAVVDALAPLGIHHLEMPVTPARVWSTIRSAEKTSAVDVERLAGDEGAGV
jgi:aerobic carbon-monoxide dehydrogenase large subunit